MSDGDRIIGEGVTTYMTAHTYPVTWYDWIYEPETKSMRAPDAPKTLRDGREAR